MKVCPSCDRTYHDDELNFCLMDGAPLTDGASQPTITFPSTEAKTEVLRARGTSADPPPEPTKRRLWVPITLGFVGLLIGTAIGATALYFFLTRKDGAATANVPAENRQTKGAKPTPTKPSASPSPTPAKADDMRTDSDIDAPIDSTPILWMTTGVPFEDDTADFVVFMCPKDGDAFPIFGVDNYEASSSICTAAVHAGLITFEDGGKVKVEFNDGAKAFGGSMRNGVTSIASGESDSGFVFLKR